ncbi:MAG: bacteriophage holin [Pseudonocardiaceae bacterium]
MPYLISVLVTGAGVVALLILLMRLIGSARRLAGTTRTSQAGLADRRGLLTARIAALRVELDRRRRSRNAAAPRATPTA